MKIWNFTKNIMLSVLITQLYAIWCKESFIKESIGKRFLVLFCVFCLVLHLFVWFDRELRRIRLERAKKYLRKEKRNEVSRTTTSKRNNTDNRH